MPRSSLRISGNKSQALIIVIAFLAMFFIIGTAFFLLSQQERLAAVKHLDAVRSRYVAEAGITYAQEVLQADRKQNVIDSLNDLPFTHFTEGAWFEMKDASGAVFGRFSVRVTDEAGKLHLNSCGADELQQLLSECGIDTSLDETLVKSRPFRAVEELGKHLSADEAARIAPLVTVYSREREIDLRRNRRPYLNTANPNLILDVFRARGIEDARQKAALLADAGDADLSRTVFVESLLDRVVPSGMIDQGGWQAGEDSYAALPGGPQGIFHWSNLAIADGQYDCYVYGVEDTDTVGVIGGQLLMHGTRLSEKITVAGGTFTLSIVPPPAVEGRFSHVRLAEEGTSQGMSRTEAAGGEAVAINEIMVAPWQDFAGSLSLSKGQRGELTFNVAHLPRGAYHLMVLAGEPGGYVGDVTAQGKTGSDMSGGDYLPAPVEVGAGGVIAVSVVNNDPVKQSVFAGIRLSRQPEGEFIELINLSPNPVDVGLFTLEVSTAQGEPVKGWPAEIPAGTLIQPYQNLVITADNDDATAAAVKLRANGVFFRKLWGFNAVHADFGAYESVIDKTFDLFPDDGAQVVLRNPGGRIVDAIEYAVSQVISWTSIERSDPAARVDSDKDGLMDGWYFSTAAAFATPGMTNENLGMYTSDGGLLKHSPSEIKLYNRPYADLSEVAGISSGKEWRTFEVRDLAMVCDSFAYAGQALWFSGEEGRDVQVDASSVGSWEFRDIPAGPYWVTIEGAGLTDVAATVNVSAVPSEQPGLALFFTDGRIHYGMTTVSGDELGSLFVHLENKTNKTIALQRIILEPLMSASGRVNVNTAPTQVLKSVLNDGALVQAVLESRPVGNRDGSFLGIGDLILINPGFLARHAKLTVRSDVYELQSRGEYLVREKPSASELIRIIYDRGDEE